MRDYVNTFVDGPLHGNCGERNAKSKLTFDEVSEILAEWLCGATQAQLARKHNVGVAAISKIVCRKTWRHVPMPDVSKEMFERNVLGVRRGAFEQAHVAGSLVAACAMQVALVSFWAADLLAPGSILRALWERRFWAAKRRERQLLHLLPPEPPTPTGPAAASALTPHQATEQWTERQPLVANGETGTDWTAPRLLHSQAVREDRAWADPDVQVIAHTRRFEVIIGGRGDGRERRQA